MDPEITFLPLKVVMNLNQPLCSQKQTSLALQLYFILASLSLSVNGKRGSSSLYLRHVPMVQNQ